LTTLFITIATFLYELKLFKVLLMNRSSKVSDLLDQLPVGSLMSNSCLYWSWKGARKDLRYEYILCNSWNRVWML